MKTVKLSKLLKLIRSKADYADSDFVDDLELVDEINMLRTELYTQVVDRCEPPSLLKQMTLIATNGVVEVPEEVYKLHSVSYEGNELREQHHTPAGRTVSSYSYILFGDTVSLPSHIPSIDITYYPVLEEIELPEEDENNEWVEDIEISLICPDERRYLVSGGVEYIFKKDESDFQSALQDKISAYQRIISTFQQNYIQPKRVRRVG